MRILYWALALLCIVGLYFSTDLHIWLKTVLPFYKISDSNLLQVILAVLAGVLATKASDSSSELKKLMKVPELKEIIEKAETSEERLKNLEKLIGEETKRQFTRDMLINHRKQLINHWEHIITLERLLSENPDTDFDPIVRKHIRNYILKSKYIDYAGRKALNNIPLIGGLLSILFGPLWDTYYSRNIEKIERRTGK
ncbi:MAG: hypothetical protein CFE21_03670 [Bacteroidetes bacterium B1(2017)]|nr:MAG: hypothetical protein CFE21_03670 [Bacteroidetes bacterium B1(2017)]